MKSKEGRKRWSTLTFSLVPEVTLCITCNGRTMGYPSTSVSSMPWACHSWWKVYWVPATMSVPATRTTSLVSSLSCVPSLTPDNWPGSLDLEANFFFAILRYILHVHDGLAADVEDLPDTSPRCQRALTHRLHDGGHSHTACCAGRGTYGWSVMSHFSFLASRPPDHTIELFQRYSAPPRMTVVFIFPGNLPAFRNGWCTWSKKVWEHVFYDYKEKIHGSLEWLRMAFSWVGGGRKIAAVEGVVVEFFWNSPKHLLWWCCLFYWMRLPPLQVYDTVAFWVVFVSVYVTGILLISINVYYMGRWKMS